MNDEIVNRHDRKPGRGIRPWLLIPKLLAVATYFGSLVTTAIIWWTVPRPSMGQLDALAPARLEQVSILMRFVVVPALLGAMVLGLLLLFQHWRQFVRLRWLQVKLVSLVLFIPTLHLFMSSRMQMLREAMAANSQGDPMWQQLDVGFAIAISASAWVIFLGRHKPRFLQNWARSFQKTKPND